MEIDIIFHEHLNSILKQYAVPISDFKDIQFYLKTNKLANVHSAHSYIVSLMDKFLLSVLFIPYAPIF